MNLTEQSFVKLKKKKKICNIEWMYEKDNVIQYANCFHNGEINLISGKYTKNSYPSNLSNKIISFTLISSGNSGVIIVSVLSSCEVAFYNVTSKWLKIIKGPQALSDLLSQFSSLKSFDPVQRLQNIARQYRFLRTNEEENENSNKTKNDCKGNVSSVSFKPRIFPSQDLSKIILITDYSKVFLLDEQSTISEVMTEPWTIYETPSGIYMPSSDMKNACIDISFIANGPTGSSCCVGYCFTSENRLIVTSLILQWRADHLRKKITPTFDWESKLIDLNNIDSASFPVKKKKFIVIKFAGDDHSLCIAVNTLKNYFHLVYYHLDDCQSVTVIDCAYPRKDQGSANRCQWVSCLAWGTGNNFIIGCLRSGHVFIATRFGHLMKINWRNADRVTTGGIYINMFPDFNISNRFSADNDTSEISSQTSNLYTPKFSILSDVSRNNIVVSSGLDFCSFSLPNEVCSNEGICSFLLKKIHHANHNLESLLVNHEYDFIHCSNWRLASKSHNKLSSKEKTREEGTVCSLWFPGNVPFSNSLVHSHVQTEFETQKTEVFELLQATWSLLALRSFNKRERKLLTKASVSEAFKLFVSIIKTSSGNDNEEHQASLIQCLRFFHNLIEYTVAVTPYTFKAFRPCLQVLYRLLNLIMKSIHEASPERKLICVIILTQTLALVKSSLIKGKILSSFKNFDWQDNKFNNILDFLMKKHWLYLYKNLLSIWKEDRIRTVSQLNCMLIVALNIIQEQILISNVIHRKTKITKEFRLFGSGKFFVAVEDTKKEINRIIEDSFCRKRLKKYIFFAFHILLVEEQWKDLINFVFWFFKKVSTPLKFNKERKLCSKKVENSMKAIFSKLCGVLGIIMAKFILGIPAYILNSFEYYDYNSVLDNPKEGFKRLNTKTFDETLFSPINASRCLIIGRKYDALFRLASKKDDLKLYIFSLLTNDIKSDSSSIPEDFLVNGISAHLTTNVENITGEELSQKEFYFISEQLFHLGVLEGLENFLPRCLLNCFKEISNLVNYLPLIVPFNFHLPSPPLFCPQMDHHDPSDTDLVDDEAKREFYTREKLSCWINQFCLLCSSSGLDGILVKYTKEEFLESNYKIKDINNICSSLLHGKEDLAIKPDNQWRELKCIWLSFLETICALHTRDTVSVALRSLAGLKANIGKFKNIQQLSCEVMKELSSFCYLNTPWKHEALSVIVTCAFDASYTVETVDLLAKAVARQSQMPSLIKDKFNKVMEIWKNIEITPINQYENSPNGMNLFHLFQVNLKSHEEKIQILNEEHFLSFPLSKECVDMICLLFDTAFLKRQMEYPGFEKPFPYLHQFSAQIKDMELEGMEPGDVLSFFIKIQSAKIFKEPKNAENTFKRSLFHSHVKQRKGLFRNQRVKQYSEGSSDTACIFYNNKITRHSDSKWRTKSFSHVTKETWKSSLLTRSNSMNNMKQVKEMYKTVSPLKCDTEISSGKLFDEFILDMYYSFLYSSYDCTSVAPRFLNLILWVLRNDRMFNKNFIPREVRDIKLSSYINGIFSISDLKQAIIWYCSCSSVNKGLDKNGSKRVKVVNTSFKREKSADLTTDIAKQSKEKDVESRMTLNNNNNNSQQFDVKKNAIEENVPNNDVESTHIAERTQTEITSNASERSCKNIGADPIYENDKYNLVPNRNSVDTGKQHELLDNVNQWQPFVVNELSTSSNHVMDSKHEMLNCCASNKKFSCNNNTNNNCTSSKELTSESRYNNIAELGSGYSITSDNSRISSSYDAIDNTLDDITLSKVLPEFDLEENALPECNVSRENFASSENKPKTFFARNNLTFLKNPLLQETKPVDHVKNLNLRKLPHEAVQHKVELIQHAPLDLSQFFNNETKAATNQEAEWTLRRIPLELLKKNSSHTDIQVPSTLLRITTETESKRPGPTEKGIRILTKPDRQQRQKKKQTHSQVQSFQLLNIPTGFKSDKFDSNGKHDMSNLADLKHTIRSSTFSDKLDKSARKLSEKFAQTPCEFDICRFAVDSAPQIYKSEANVIKHKLQHDGHVEESSKAAKRREKTFESKQNQTNIKEIILKLTENSTQTINLEESSGPKIPTEILINNAEEFVKDYTMKETPTESKKVQTNLKGINLESKENATQTRNLKEISALQISAETQTPKEEKRRVTNKATSISLQNTSKSNSFVDGARKDNSEIGYSFDFVDIGQESNRDNLKKQHYEQKRLPESSLRENNIDSDSVSQKLGKIEIVQADYDGSDSSKADSDLILLTSSKHSEYDDNIGRNVAVNPEPECIGDTYDKASDELLTDNSSLNTQTQSRPETIQDVINLFMSGQIHVDQVCNLVSSFPEYIDMMNMNSNLNETPRNMLVNVVDDVNKVKQEIVQTKTLLEKVDFIASKCFQEDLKVSKYFSTLLKHRKSPAKIQFPSKPSPVQLMEYLQQMSPNDLTQNEVSQILEQVERETNSNCRSALSSENKIMDPTSYSPTVTQSEMVSSEIVEGSHSRTTIGKKYLSYETIERNQQINYHHQSPDLNLNLPKFGLGAYSPVVTVTSSDSVNAKEQRRREIRAFMQRKRCERRENSPKPLVACNNKGSLTGKEILDRNRSMENRRQILKKEHLKMRTEECEYILEDHFRERESVQPILGRNKFNSHSPSRSFVLNKKLKVDSESAFNLYKNKVDVETIAKVKRERQKLTFDPCGLLLKRELKRFSDYLTMPQSSDRCLRLNKGKSTPTSKSIRENNFSKLPLNETFTRSLERISEIDSSSVSSTLTDSSWSLPDNIERILNHNDEIL